MTPPPASTHAPSSPPLSLRRGAAPEPATWLKRLIDFPGWSGLRWLVDGLALYAAAAAALLGYAENQPGNSKGWIAAIYPLVALLLLHIRRGPDERLQASRLETAAHVLGVTSMAAMMTIAGAAVVGQAHPLSIVIRLWLFSAVYVATARVVLVSLRRGAVKSDLLSTPTLIVGAGVVGERLVKRLLEQPSYGLRPVGFLDPHPMRSPSGGGLPILGGIDDLPEAIERSGARHVILAFSNQADSSFVPVIRNCHALGVRVSLVPRLFEAINQRSSLDHVGGLPLVELRPTDPDGWRFAVKHTIDRSFAAIVLLAVAPLMAATALIVRFTSPGPIMFRQRRVGRDGRVFDVLKFRTMRIAEAPSTFVPADGCAPGGVEGDDRRTPVGRLLRETSLDELPQLINVLRGEMSLVGPRPERPEYVERFAVEFDRYQDRHRVKSGMTGWAQVNGLRGQTSIADRVEWDNYYIQNWSLRLDLQILAMTVGEVLRCRG